MTHSTPLPARDHLGRILDVSEDASPEEIAEAVARRDAEDRRNLDTLRRTRRLGNLAPSSSTWT